MSRTHWAVAVLLTSVAVLPAAIHAEEPTGGHYIAGPGGAAIWCHADHDIVQNTENALGNDWGPLDPKWPLYAEPECWASDVLNDAREATGDERVEWGFGGFAWAVPPEDLGTTVRVATDDELSGTHTFMTLYAGTEGGDDVVTEGCGPRVMVLPLDLERHWMWTYEDPLHIYWAYIPLIGIHDNLHLCVASTGWIEGG